MAAPSAAEQGITHCQACGKEFQKSNVRVPTYREGRFWFECLECFEKLGGVTWAKNVVKRGIDK